MEDLTVRIKIAVLWLFMAVAYAAHMALSIFEPGVIELILDGEIRLTEGEFIFSVLFAWLIPMTMAFLSLILK